MTLRDLKELCDRFVPKAARHPNSTGAGSAWWWSAHEIGHLLIATPREITQPMFGLDDRDNDGNWTGLSTHYRLTREKAEMHVSFALLTACGREDIARQEIDETDDDTVNYNDRGAVKRLLRMHRVLRVPRTRARLERKLERKIKECTP